MNFQSDQIAAKSKHFNYFSNIENERKQLTEQNCLFIIKLRGPAHAFGSNQNFSETKKIIYKD